MINKKNIFGQSFQMIKQDRYIQLLCLVPVLMGIVLYYLIGNWIFNDLYTMGHDYISGKMGEGSFASFFGYILVGLLSVGFYFIINWGFFLIVSMIAAPFNDLISERVEKGLQNDEKDPIGLSMKRIFKNIVFLIVHQIKKFLFFSLIGIIGFALSFTFPPISIFISAILLGVSFLDYSWERHLMTFRESLADLRSNFFSYGMGGGIFLLLISIPIVNLFILPLGVVYFTVLFVNKR